MTVDRNRLQPTSVSLAPRLLGAVLVSSVGGVDVAVRITEVEAYEGAEDPASHAYRGPTPRTEVMFGPPGHLYTYFTYGMHWCANIVCGPPGRASAILLRAGEVVEGIEAARLRRPASKSDTELGRGPARLATTLGLAREQNGADLCDATSVVRLRSMPKRRPRGSLAGPRVGISQAQDRPWRFWLAGEPSVSMFRPGGRQPARGAGQTDGRD